MYVRPGHKPERNPAPPEQGERLLTIPRGDDEELRLTRDVFNGHPYLGLRVWTRDQWTSAWWPSKRGCSIRLSEASAIAEALASVEAPTPREARPQAPLQGRPAFRLNGGNGPGRPPGRPTAAAPQPNPDDHRRDFDEFS